MIFTIFDDQSSDCEFWILWYCMNIQLVVCMKINKVSLNVHILNVRLNRNRVEH